MFYKSKQEIFLPIHKPNTLFKGIMLARWIAARCNNAGGPKKGDKHACLMTSHVACGPINVVWAYQPTFEMSPWPKLFTTNPFDVQ